jgi:hypothetical protein
MHTSKESLMAAATKTVTLTARPADGPLAAASLVTAILKQTGSKSLDELYGAVRAGDSKAIAKLGGLAITEDQFELIEVYGDVVSHLRIVPTTAISRCNQCGKISIVAGMPASKCALTLGCEGKPEKSGAATKTPVTD